MSTTTAPVSYYDDPTPNPTSDDLARAAVADDRASDVDEFTRRVDELTPFALIQSGGAPSEAEWADLFGRFDIPPETKFPAWLDDLPGMDADPEVIAEYLAAAPLHVDDVEHGKLRVVLKRVTSAPGAGGPGERYGIEGSREKLAVVLMGFGLRLAALEAVHYDELPPSAFHLRDEELEPRYGGRAEYAREVTEAVFERFLRELEGGARHLLREADELDREADELRAAAEAAATAEEAEDLHREADAYAAAGRATRRVGRTFLEAVDRFRSDLRRARRARHRRPATRRRPPRCALRGSPATVTRCPAAPHGPPTRAPRVRYAATVA